MTEIATLPLEGPYFGREGRPYSADEGLIHAANTALALGRPLLLSGEPGVGKTDFAFAAARYLAEAAGRCWREPMGPGDHREFGLLECYVRSDTTARDLLYTYDAVGRFGDAYLRKQTVENPAHYIELRGLGLALASSAQRVVLIDELDKAPRDLPNDLLRELDQGCFVIAELEDQHADRRDRNDILLRREMGHFHRPIAERPLVVITTNEERPLPSAFLRRCIYHHVPFPPWERLVEILHRHCKSLEQLHGTPKAPEPDDIGPAVTAFTRLREQGDLTRRPSTSELIEWVTALWRLGVEGGRAGAHNLRLAAEAAPSQDSGSWKGLPRLMCLVKTSEDRRELGLEA